MNWDYLEGVWRDDKHIDEIYSVEKNKEKLRWWNINQEKLEKQTKVKALLEWKTNLTSWICKTPFYFNSEAGVLPSNFDKSAELPYSNVVFVTSVNVKNR